MDIYADNILDHFQNPRHHGALAQSTIAVEEINPLCGDKIHLELLIENDRIKDIGFTGEGCAISQAGISLLTEEIYLQSVADAEKITKDNVYRLIGVPLSPARVKCGLLGFAALKKALILYRHRYAS